MSADNADPLAPDPADAAAAPPGGSEAAPPPLPPGMELATAQLNDLCGIVLDMVPDAMARMYGDDRFRLQPDEKRPGQTILRVATVVYAEDILKYVKVLLVIAALGWGVSVAIPRLALMGEHKRKKMEDRRGGAGEEAGS